MRDIDPSSTEYITSGYLARSHRKSTVRYDIGSIAGSVIGNVAGSLIGARATRKAASTQAEAAKYSADLQKQIFDKQTELQEPFRQAGLTGQNRLMELLGLAGDPNAQGYGSAMRDFGAQDFQTDPGYQFRQQQGQQGLERSAAARGGLLSGAAMKDAMRFNQGLASDEYTNAFNRFQTNRSNKLNPLQSLAGVGQSSTNQISQAAGNYGVNAGNAMMGAADARASGYLMNGRIASNALNQIGAYGSKNNWWQAPKTATFGANLDGFFGGTGGSGD